MYRNSLAVFALLGFSSAFAITYSDFSSNYGVEKVQPITNFTAAQYAGVWYEVARTPNIFEFGLKCVTATYSLNADGRIGLVNRGIRMYPFPKRVSKIHGVAVAPDTLQPAKLKVKFHNIPGLANYWILDTDYKSWAVVYSPSSTLPHPPAVYVLTREQFPAKKTIQTALNVLALKTGILVNDLTMTIQEAGNC